MGDVQNRPDSPVCRRPQGTSNARHVATLAGLTTRKGDCTVAGENRRMASVKASETAGAFGLLSLLALLPDPLSQQHKAVKDQQ